MGLSHNLERNIMPPKAKESKSSSSSGRDRKDKFAKATHEAVIKKSHPTAGMNKDERRSYKVYRGQGR